MTIDNDKAELRAECLNKRKALHAALPQAGELACDHFLNAIGFPDDAVISAYLPVKDEFDVLPFAEVADLLGHIVGMPLVTAKATALTFLEWTPECAMVEGAMGIPTPPLDAAKVEPELLLVPMMAYDSDGFRLGYGGGFYDRTLAALRKRNPDTMAVGVCFAGLEVDHVPHDDHDARLDWVVTEQGARRI
ncbi:MAG: 5-formyltetrahydrofolate cyclo-ligase [Alphaproteobacteria bacterium]|jgi:5-formyltetrahydrofolate cyclo-ligase|nr:5-formyltetrahydrofolate cyclo-ligase [Rhodospirillaceae bacterium]MDG2479503.1 5-formyltetrahydrofolate cyclo-ligase [Alphaproteobacteria bacterium]MBT6206300.1 5-formyltetrahydrofolate cyclo-ligase [Rhodospirillaceae bacterium]MBT6508957.1 5-formyltetrahydrofolate cyclo-ligase [Rhodospirillaceae bacterium]MBT7612628.1 5-formyltetrahydrofolate cyclo-ligase [Rhodospirillaceae bacterium]